MRKADDSSLSRAQRDNIRTEARRALEAAGALGHFPTNVPAVMAEANATEVHEDVLSEPGFLEFMRRQGRKAGGVLKSALDKVLGLFDARAGEIFIDRSLHRVKQTFIRLHETAHAYLPWQRKMYTLVEDSALSIDPDVADLFDREANVFASDVLFQLDTFSKEANDQDFGIFVPVNLGKKYGASAYASIRRYMAKHHKTCVVVVLDPPQFDADSGFRAALRRPIPSPTFQARFSRIAWADHFTPDDDIGAMVPLGKRRASGKRTIELTDDNGNRHECIAEAFTQGYQVFVLIHVTQALTANTVLVA